MILPCRPHFGQLAFVCLIGCLVACSSSVASAQQDAPFVRATAVLPSSTAGLVRIPNYSKVRDAWKQTRFGRLLDDPAMQPFVKLQRKRIDDYLQSLPNKFGIRLEDLSEITTGEVVVAWIPFKNDKRRPFTICLIADIRTQRQKAEKALETLDKDLKKAGWNRKDEQHAGQTIRVYDIQPKPGQLKLEQIAITIDDNRIIAADRDSVVTGLVDAIAKGGDEDCIEKSDDFVSILKRSTKAIQPTILAGGSTVALEWFGRPFEMGRVLRETLDIDRRNQVDIIKLLEGQGFDVIRGLGGVIAIDGQRFDLLHRGFILADQTKLEKAAKMLQFINEPLQAIPDWVHDEVATFNRLNMKIEDAFWASETLINEAFDDEIFRDIVEGIRDDEDGPRIDLEKNVLPNLDDQIILLSDNVQPAGIDSERILLALRVKDGKAIEKAIRKAMEVEPDASKLDLLPGVEIWQVERSESADDFDQELFGDLDIDFGDEEAEDAPPLLEHWAIGLVPAGPGSTAPYLMFSSHPEFLVQTANRILKAAPNAGFGNAKEVKEVRLALSDLGAGGQAFDRVVRSRLSLRIKYELWRQGKLKDSDTVLGSIYRRIFDETEADDGKPLAAKQLPPLKQVEKYFPNGGSSLKTTKDGWEIIGFLLK